MKPIIYRGFQIFARKKMKLPLYYAWVYSENGDRPGFKVDRDCEMVESRERIIELAKFDIDQELAE